MKLYELTKQTVSTVEDGVIEPTPQNIARAREFLFRKWTERAREMGRPDPADLSDSCKYSSLFVQKIFGGRVRGNERHQFVQLENGKILDLNSGANDVRTMERPYEHDPKFFANPKHVESMQSCEATVIQWAAEFKQSLIQNESVVLNEGMEKKIVQFAKKVFRADSYAGVEKNIIDDWGVLERIGSWLNVEPNVLEGVFRLAYVGVLGEKSADQIHSAMFRLGQFDATTAGRIEYVWELLRPLMKTKKIDESYSEFVHGRYMINIKTDQIIGPFSENHLVYVRMHPEQFGVDQSVLQLGYDDHGYFSIESPKLYAEMERRGWICFFNSPVRSSIQSIHSVRSIRMALSILVAKGGILDIDGKLVAETEHPYVEYKFDVGHGDDLMKFIKTGAYKKVYEGVTDLGALSRLVRSEIKVSDPKKVAGHCEWAANRLGELLDQKGIPHQVESGSYNGIPHWWVRVGHLILDPTRDQFGDRQYMIGNPEIVGKYVPVLSEGRKDTLPVADDTGATDEATVWIDPNAAELHGILRHSRYKTLRGAWMHDHQKKSRFVLWDADWALHHEMMRAIEQNWGWTPECGFLVDQSSDGTENGSMRDDGWYQVGNFAMDIPNFMVNQPWVQRLMRTSPISKGSSLNESESPADKFRTDFQRAFKKYEGKAFVDLITIDQTHVEIESIEVKNKGRGIGSEVMSLITDLADRYGVILTLVAQSKYDPDDVDYKDAMEQHDLIRWYYNFGFDHDPSHGMIRMPG